MNPLSNRILKIGYEITLGRRITDKELSLLLQHISDEIKEVCIIPPAPPSKEKIERILREG